MDPPKAAQGRQGLLEPLRAQRMFSDPDWLCEALAVPLSHRSPAGVRYLGHAHAAAKAGAFEALHCLRMGDVRGALIAWNRGNVFRGATAAHQNLAGKWIVEFGSQRHRVFDPREIHLLLDLRRWLYAEGQGQLGGARSTARLPTDDGGVLWYVRAVVMPAIMLVSAAYVVAGWRSLLLRPRSPPTTAGPSTGAARETRPRP